MQLYCAKGKVPKYGKEKYQLFLEQIIWIRFQHPNGKKYKHGI